MLKVLLIGHFLGDFYLQFNIIQKNKSNWLWLILHSFIYAFVVTFCFSLYRHRWWIIVLFVIFFASHLVADKCKCLLEKRLHKSKFNHKFDLLIYIIDQLIHIAIIVGVVCFFSGSTLNQFGVWIYNVTRCFKTENLAGIVLTAMIIFVPTSTFIVKLFDSLPKSDKEDNGEATTATAASECGVDSKRTNILQKDELKAGKIIGYLERSIILILFITELYTLIGLVLTAKSLARFKQLENRYFAEKFLIGTLLSLVITILTYSICKI